MDEKKRRPPIAIEAALGLHGFSPRRRLVEQTKEEEIRIRSGKIRSKSLYRERKSSAGPKDNLRNSEEENERR
jgi:hypothetical protein